MSETRKEHAGEPSREGNKHPVDPLLKIVKARDPKAKDGELDLGIDEFEGDHRYGREDIADK